jgi:hypothetical protein
VPKTTTPCHNAIYLTRSVPSVRQKGICHTIALSVDRAIPKKNLLQRSAQFVRRLDISGRIVPRGVSLTRVLKETDLIARHRTDRVDQVVVIPLPRAGRMLWLTRLQKTR